MVEGGIKLTDQELQLMYLFENVTGVPAKDCILDGRFKRIIFVVGKGMAPIAVGKNGSKIKALKGFLGKDVEVIEYGNSLEEAIKNSLFPAQVSDIEVRGGNERRMVIVRVPMKHMGVAIGRDGRNIARAKLVLRRYFGIGDLRIVTA